MFFRVRFVAIAAARSKSPHVLIRSLTTTAEPRDRAIESEKSRQRAKLRFSRE
jgi:hypothetical protein